MFDLVFKNDQNMEGIRFTIPYQIESRSQDQVISDLVGELWRLIINFERGDLVLQNRTYPQGLRSMPQALWEQGQELFEQMSDEKRNKFAFDMMRLSRELNINMEGLSENIPDVAKDFAAAIVAAAIEAETLTSIPEVGIPTGHLFGSILKDLREKSNLSQVQLARMIKASPMAIIQWEKGTRFPQSKYLKELISILGEDLLWTSELTVAQKDSLGIAIKKLRKRNLLTQLELANKMDVDISTISRWENDVLDPSIVDFQKLIRILGNKLLAINRFTIEDQTIEAVPLSSKGEQDAETFSAILQRLRLRLGLSQVEFGKRIGVSGIAVFQWENEKRMPYPDNLVKLIIEFGDDLLLSRELRLNREDSLPVAIQKLRLRKGLTQGELAERMRNGIDASNVSRWENNEYPPSLKDLSLLINVLGENLLLIDEFKAQKESQVSSSGVDQNELKYGGINLNPRYLNLQIKRDSQGIPLPLIQQPINRMQIEGFIPIIINIVPVNVLRLSSENKKEESQDLHLVSN
ncbi:MAG: helix-turn-helix domain-containing protein [Candidatus Omnitrophica bacterium]|nr:helix-turn-helix domain-containing protein [Candidatus Omnitrophota bacterium]